MRLPGWTGRLARQMKIQYVHPSLTSCTSVHFATPYTQPLQNHSHAACPDPQRTLSAPKLTLLELHFLGLAEEFHTEEMQKRSLPGTASVHDFGQYGALLRKFSKRPSSKLERFIYKKRGKVLRMDFVGGGCRSRGSWAVSKASSGRKQQKRREVQSLSMNRRREGWEVANWSRGVGGCISGLLL